MIQRTTPMMTLIESNASLTGKDTADRQIIVHSSTQIKFVRFTPEMEFAGNSIVTKDILNYAGMARDVLEENPVDIYTVNLPVTDVNSFLISAITVNSANTVFVTGAQSSKHTFRVSMMIKTMTIPNAKTFTNDYGLVYLRTAFSTLLGGFSSVGTAHGMDFLGAVLGTWKIVVFLVLYDVLYK